MQQIPYESQKYLKRAFNCPFCNAFADQEWTEIYYYDKAEHLNNSDERDYICFCVRCKKYSIWHDREMIYPIFTGIEIPNQDLGESIINDYDEAAEILQRSPRGAGALLRLAIQKLCIQLGGDGKNLNTDIGTFVKNGLPVKVQQSLDSLRVIGNEAVHPGELNLQDDVETVQSLFKLVNFIAEKMITEPKEIEAIYSKIPETKKEQIEKRDGKE